MCTEGPSQNPGELELRRKEERWRRGGGRGLRMVVQGHVHPCWGLESVRHT